VFKYVVTLMTSGIVIQSKSQSSEAPLTLLFGDLSSDVTYSCNVVAWNAVGASPDSEPPALVSPTCTRPSPATYVLLHLLMRLMIMVVIVVTAVYEPGMSLR
jgi:hypothetical protein